MRLIDADKLTNYIRMNFAQCMRQKSVLTSIDEQPTIDAKEGEHGEWVYGEDVDIQCSVCGWDALIGDDYLQVKSAYCPHCGAKMGGAE